MEKLKKSNNNNKQAKYSMCLGRSRETANFHANQDSSYI